jgi:hypothetical protein
MKLAPQSCGFRDLPIHRIISVLSICAVRAYSVFGTWSMPKLDTFSVIQLGNQGFEGQ